MIDKISILCLDKRFDLWTELKAKVETIFNRSVETFICGKGEYDLKYDHIDEPIKNIPWLYLLNNGHYNAFLCHKKMCQRALDEGCNNLLILEDDAYLIEDRIDKIFYSANVQYFLHNNSWDIVYLGWWLKKSGLLSEDREDLEEDWKQNKTFGIDKVPRPPEMQHEICGLHGALINRCTMNKIANANIGPIDSLINHNLDNINAYFIFPKVIHVRSTWSYCENSFVNRNKI